MQILLLVAATGRCWGTEDGAGGRRGGMKATVSSYVTKQAVSC